MTTRLQVAVDARPECVQVVRDVVARAASAMGLSGHQLYAIKFCVGEAVTNVVKHAYPAGHHGPVEVHLRESGGELEIAVADGGPAPRPARVRREGGFGLVFVSRLASGCTLTAAPGGTTVEMRFRLPRWKDEALGVDGLSADHLLAADRLSRRAGRRATASRS